MKVLDIEVGGPIKLRGVDHPDLITEVIPAHTTITDVIRQPSGWPQPLGDESTVYVAKVSGKQSTDEIEDLLSQFAGMGYFPASRRTIVALRKQHPDRYTDFVLASLIGMVCREKLYYPVSDMSLCAFQVMGYHVLGVEMGLVDFLKSVPFYVVLISPCRR